MSLTCHSTAGRNARSTKKWLRRRNKALNPLGILWMDRHRNNAAEWVLWVLLLPAVPIAWIIEIIFG